MTVTLGVGQVVGGGTPPAASAGRLRDSAAEIPSTDSVDISPAADAAAAAARIAAKEAAEEVRREAIERARKQIQEGTYRMQEIVGYVAQRIGRFM